MKNKGFTLVELLAVIVILGLLLTIAVPNILKVSGNVKEKSYATKIKMIESAGIAYGQKNYISELTQEQKNKDGHHEWIKVTVNNNIKSVQKSNGTTYEGYVPSVAIAVDRLAKSKNLSYDMEHRCKKNNSVECLNYYDKVITNPINDNIINFCTVYIYLKNNRIYSVFDRATCDQTQNSAANGHEYVDKVDTFNTEA